MKLVVRNRGGGKSRNLALQAIEDKNIVIIVATNPAGIASFRGVPKEQIIVATKHMEKDRLVGKKVMVDELTKVLEALLGVEVHTATDTPKEMDIRHTQQLNHSVIAKLVDGELVEE